LRQNIFGPVLLFDALPTPCSRHGVFQFIDLYDAYAWAGERQRDYGKDYGKDRFAISYQLFAILQFKADECPVGG
jgi:hypothetical protein